MIQQTQEKLGAEINGKTQRRVLVFEPAGLLLRWVHHGQALPNRSIGKIRSSSSREGRTSEWDYGQFLTAPEYLPIGIRMLLPGRRFHLLQPEC